MKNTIHEISFSKPAQRFLDDATREQQHLIGERIRRLLTNPVPSDAKCIGRHANELVYRVRVGKYRVLYKLKGGTIIISVIGRRDRVY